MSGIQSVSVNAAQSYASVGAQSQQSLAPFANLNVTEAQRAQLRSIFNNAKQNGTSPSDIRSQVDSILSPAQQHVFANDIRSHGGHHRGAGPDSDQSTPDRSSAGASTTDAAGTAETTTLDAVTNVQKQSVAANATLLKTLQSHVLESTNLNATAAAVAKTNESETNG
jgi:hypothetical protein